MMRVTEYESSVRVRDQYADRAGDLVGGSVIPTYRRIISPTTSISNREIVFSHIDQSKLTHASIDSEPAAT